MQVGPVKSVEGLNRTKDGSPREFSSDGLWTAPLAVLVLHPTDFGLASLHDQVLKITFLYIHSLLVLFLRRTLIYMNCQVLYGQKKMNSYPGSIVHRQWASPNLSADKP